VRTVLLVFITSLLVGLPSAQTASTQPATATTWPDAIAPLVELKAKAQICVALLKRHGSPAQITDNQPAYARAKAESDAVISGLRVAIAARDTPATLTSLQERLAKSTNSLAGFCNAVDAIIQSATTTGQKDVWSALAKMLGIENFVNKLSDGIATLYNNYRSDNALTRRVIEDQLEFARWPEFAVVEPAP
jgi:hypothetical protein